MERLVPCYILAGGHSSRFGSNKALARADGLELLLHMVRAVQPVSNAVTLVGRSQGQYDQLGLCRTIGDTVADLGPVGGLATALADLAPQQAAKGPWLLLCPCDVLGLQTAWLQTLLKGRHPDHLAVAFKGQRWEPLPGLYHVDALPAVQAAIDQGQLSLWRTLQRCSPAALPLPEQWEQARRVNRPEDLPG